MLTKNGNGEKRGPGRPKGSTNKGTEQKQLLAQQSNDIIKGMAFFLLSHPNCYLHSFVL